MRVVGLFEDAAGPFANAGAQNKALTRFVPWSLGESIIAADQQRNA
jgi:hypothetical protein